MSMHSRKQLAMHMANVCPRVHGYSVPFAKNLRSLPSLEESIDERFGMRVWSGCGGGGFGAPSSQGCLAWAQVSDAETVDCSGVGVRVGVRVGDSSCCYSTRY